MINSYLWNEEKGYYFDLSSSGIRMGTKTAAAFWTMAAEVATFPQARLLAQHLQNPAEFYRKHLFPSLSADHPAFDPKGLYWNGGVWAPLNYMIIKGLDMYPLQELAMLASVNHLQNLHDVYQNYTPDSAQIAPSERDGHYQTLWESYAPDLPRPATRWDGNYLVRQDFVGWSGLGPIALLLENIIGLQPVAPEDKLYWNLRLRERHGVENYRFGDNVVDILCESNDLPAGSAIVKISSNSAFELAISSQIGKEIFQIAEGSQYIKLEF
jgi:glycogen debranching enzyme